MPDSVVLVSPSGGVFHNLEPLRRSIATGTSESPPKLTVVTWRATDALAGVTTVALFDDQRSDVRSLDGRWNASLAARTLRRISPWDPSRVFWRAVRRNPAAMSALLSSQLLIAVERDAILTVWAAARRSLASDLTAVYGLQAGIATLEQG